MSERMKFAGKLLSVVLLIGLLFSFAMFQGGFTSWFLFFGFLPIFLYHLSLLLYPVHNWQVSRRFSRNVIRTGDHVDVTIRVKRNVPYPLYYCICEEIFPVTLQRTKGNHDAYRFLNEPYRTEVNRTIKKIVFPGFRREIEFPYVLQQVPRGEHQLQFIRIRVGDVFGFVKKEHIFHVNDQVVAFPDKREVYMTDTFSSFEQGSISSYALNLKNTNVATGVREYEPGDKFSWIDWKQTAKKNNVITKEFEQEKSTDTVVVLDACDHRGINKLAFEASIELTVSLLEYVRKQASQVGFLSVGEEAVYFPMHHDPVKADAIQRHLTRIQPEGVYPFSLKLQNELPKLPNGSNMIMVTTYLDDKFMEMIKKTRQQAKQVTVLFIQGSALISDREHAIIEKLYLGGIVINVLTEKQLVRNDTEVSVS
ncbi:DUF58 domain-containing protein [Virgibacillus siamensis]|uniref:DUF58 domain-containing protein n=1 Tax=Virgibacillus siamensis TaxID=480071 RepID=UPI00098503A3|nr:DUF58 domain-containing protein [Virgibacillus siamensis]